jgi:SAM-dependent methyltransferase
LWQRNLDRIPPDWTITLSDFSPGMVQEAQRNLRDSGRTFTFQVTDAQTIPLEASRFDIVIADNMLYHVPDRQRALSEAHRVLKPEGHFYASTIGEASFSNMKSLMRQKGIAMPLWGETPGFSLENGGEQLSFWFTHVDLYHTEHTFLITESEPVLQMIRASIGGSDISELDMQIVHESIDQELAQHGSLPVTMHFGIFVAHGLK